MLGVLALLVTVSCGDEKIPDEGDEVDLERDAASAHVEEPDASHGKDASAVAPPTREAASPAHDASATARDADSTSVPSDAGPTAPGDAGVRPADDAGSQLEPPRPLSPLTLWIAGDSTVMSYPASDAPQEGWGQEIGGFFSSLVKVNNQALGGRSTRTFMFGNVTCSNGKVTYTGGTPTETGTRWERIRQNLAAGDYLLIQFGHNDNGTVCERHVDLPEFKQNLSKMIAVVRERSATPILVTPMSQLSYTNNQFRATLTNYAQAMKETAAAEQAELVDLNTLSIAFYRSKGHDYVANQMFLVGETTHFQKQGALDLARLIASGLRDTKSALAPYLKPAATSP